jgi:hypothetical protein
MEEASRVLRRLERIESLDRESVPAERLLGELRALVSEAEAWARLDPARRARELAPKVRGEAGGMA